MRVFVTGATGFIGQHLVRRLVKDGHDVTCLVRHSSRTEVLCGLGVRLVYGDVNDHSALLNGMAGCDWLFHLANLYSMWEPDPSQFERINVDGTQTVLSCALASGVKKAVYVSTVAVFGKPSQSPFDETCQPGPVLFSAYARSKYAAEQAAWAVYRQGLPLVVIYPGIVLGAGDLKASGQYIQDIIFRRVPSTIFHQAQATYVYVEDVIEALVRAAEKPETVGQKYLLGQTCLDGRAFAQLISRISGTPLPLLHFPDFCVLAAAYLLTGLAYLIRRPPWWGLSVDAAWTLKNGFYLDGSKASSDLEIAYTPIEQALAEAVAYYRERRL